MKLHINPIEVVKRAKKRDDVVDAYAYLLSTEPQNALEPWGSLNRAIIERWSLSGLEYIKTKAWKLVEEER